MRFLTVLLALITLSNFVYSREHSPEEEIASGKAADYLRKHIPDTTNPESEYYYYLACLYTHQPEKALPLLECTFRPKKHQLTYVRDYYYPYSSDYDYCAGLILQYNGQLELALEHFKNFKSRITTDGYSIGLIDFYLTQTKHKGIYFDREDTLFVKNLGKPVNSKYNDHSPIYWNDELYFGSNRTIYKNMDTQYDKIYNYKFRNQPELVFKGLAKREHSPLCPMLDDSTLMIYIQDHKRQGNFYISEMGFLGFGKPVKTDNPINSKFVELSATFSNTDSTVYFSSDRPEGYGGLDIYKSKLLADGTWTEPINLGKEVNTVFNEDAPFYDDELKTLFFSSNSQYSLGGFDLFKSELIDGKFESSANLGFPINTSHDEIFMTKMKDQYVFSSDRKSSLGGLDLYKFDTHLLHDNFYKWHITGFPDSLANSIDFQNCSDVTLEDHLDTVDASKNYAWVVDNDTLLSEKLVLCYNEKPSYDIRILSLNAENKTYSTETTFTLKNEPVEFFIKEEQNEKMLSSNQAVPFEIEKAYWKENEHRIYTDYSIPNDITITEAFFKINLEGNPYIIKAH